MPYARLGAAAVVALVALAVFFAHDVQMMRSGLTAANAADEAVSGDRTEAISLLKRAAELTPDVQQYHVWAGELLLGEALREPDGDIALDILRDAREISPNTRTGTRSPT